MNATHVTAHGTGYGPTRQPWQHTSADGRSRPSARRTLSATFNGEAGLATTMSWQPSRCLFPFPWPVGVCQNMSGERAPWRHMSADSSQPSNFGATFNAEPPAGRSELLRGGRARSYGSLVRSPLSPVRQRRVEHQVQPEDTLQGLSLKYGVSMEQIKRANRLYTNESIFLKKSLWIPVPSDPSDPRGDWVDSVSEGDDDVEGVSVARRDSSPTDGLEASSSERKPSGGDDDGKERPSDLTPVDFLKRLDGLISQSKQAAAARGGQDGEERVAAIEAACTSGTSDLRPPARSQSVTSFPRVHLAAPLAATKRTKKLRDREDELFQL
ncbi:lysM and putative peptidoglycan-binding domain-containing protein 1 [Cyclopterus lumpus]|uniref:LysM and putative peptidoglycan-binding domain-containing protein 1 n=1 Tax=Cyclopterus lumpus TaxID=8103 RepID=A0A8C2Z1X3_CYCLU|nr:lysM and putative peptidoglycan-binding domain-containing protein 1 [Cyclopterus lumpus]